MFSSKSLKLVSNKKYFASYGQNGCETVEFQFHGKNLFVYIVHTRSLFFLQKIKIYTLYILSTVAQLQISREPSEVGITHSDQRRHASYFALESEIRIWGHLEYKVHFMKPKFRYSVKYFFVQFWYCATKNELW